jgi:tetratricopeptide (TPR) repeat protein
MIMADTNSNRTLMALLEVDLEEEAGDLERLPGLDERANMFLRAVHGPDAEPTAGQRTAARERILAAMAADLAEQTMEPTPEPTTAASPARGAAAQSATRIGAGWAEFRSQLIEAAQRLLAPAGEVFAMRAVRMAAVPLLALLVVGSIWTGTWIAEEIRTEPGPASPPAGSARDATAPTTRSLTSPAERDLMRDIAAAQAGRGPMSPDAASKMVDLAGLYRAQGRYADAERLYNRALTIQQRALGARHPDTIRTTRELAELYRAEGRRDEADDLLRGADRP